MATATALAMDWSAILSRIRQQGTRMIHMNGGPS